MTFCKIHKFNEKYNLPYGYSNRTELLPKRDGFITKKALEIEKGIRLHNTHFCVICTQMECDQLKQLKK